MPRPSRHTEDALLASGRALFAERGCAGLSLRAVAEHAGVNVGMFHYHFGSKSHYLQALLQQMYEEMYAQLSSHLAHAGRPLPRLRQALLGMGGFLREHGAVVGRVWADAGNGEPVAREFVQANAPRHLGLLMALLDEAERAGDIAPMAPMQRFTFLMGSVLAPMLLAQRVLDLRIAPPRIAPLLAPQVLSDEALAARIDLAIAALRAKPRRSARA